MKIIDMPSREKLTDFKKAIANLYRDMDDIKEFNKARAEIAKSFYDDLIGQKFTPEQALTIVTSKLL